MPSSKSNPLKSALKFFGRVILLVAVLGPLAVLSSPILLRHSAPSAPPLPAVIAVKPEPDNSLLVNPGKGFVQYYSPDDTYTKDCIGVGYGRCYWADIEPVEGRFNWSVIDNCIRDFKSRGKKTGFRLMNVGTGMGHEYATPKWVFDAGAVPLEVPDDSSPTGKQVVPKDWADPVFLKKMHNTIRALGKRYDGNPDIAFFDIGDYGNWGEGHLGGLPGSKWAPGETFKPEYVQPYIDAFPHTQLILLWGGATDGVWDWAIAQGIGVRRDGILSKWTDGSECAKALGHAPAVYEDDNNYTKMKKAGTWPGNDWVTAYLRAGKPTYWQWDKNFMKDAPDFYKQLGNKLGYHFILLEARIPEVIKPGVPFRLMLTWLNDGVAPVYEPCHVAMALLDSNDHVVAREWLPESNPKNWLPDEVKTEEMKAGFTSVPAGIHKFAIGLFHDKKDANPAYKLGIKGRNADGWYILQN